MSIATVINLLDLAEQNIQCARSALARGQYATSASNAECGRDLLDHFASRITSGSIATPDNSSITNPNTPTAEAEEKQTSIPREDAGADA